MIDIDDKQHVRNVTHVLDTTQAALQLFLLAGKAENFFLRESFESAIFSHLLQRRKTFYRLTNGLVVGQHAAEPALADKRHFAALGVRLQRLTCRTLGANKQDLSAIGDCTLNKGTGFARKRQALFEVNNVDFVTFAKDVG